MSAVRKQSTTPVQGAPSFVIAFPGAAAKLGGPGLRYRCPFGTQEPTTDRSREATALTKPGARRREHRERRRSPGEARGVTLGTRTGEYVGRAQDEDTKRRSPSPKQPAARNSPTRHATIRRSSMEQLLKEITRSVSSGLSPSQCVCSAVAGADWQPAHTNEDRIQYSATPNGGQHDPARFDHRHPVSSFCRGIR